MYYVTDMPCTALGVSKIALGGSKRKTALGRSKIALDGSKSKTALGESKFALGGSRSKTALGKSNRPLQQTMKTANHEDSFIFCLRLLSNRLLHHFQRNVQRNMYRYLPFQKDCPAQHVVFS